MSDVELIGRILSGEKRLFSRIVERYAGYVWGLCSSYVRNPTECEDIVQEVFIQCYLRLDTLRDRSAFGKWLSGMARKQCLFRLRGAARRKVGIARYLDHLRTLPLENGISPTETLSAQEKRQLVGEMVNSLPPKLRETLVLYYAEGYSATEVAEFLGTSEATIWKRLERGRKALKEKVIL
ncbi:RNA polymerase sigma factor [Candidatus Hydrogenedentota bacterium]